MDILGERRYKPWKAPKMRKRVKSSKLSRIPRSIFRTCKRLLSGLFRPSYSRYTYPMVPLEHPPLRHEQDPNAFMACRIQTEPGKRGWLRTATKLASSCEDLRLNVDKEAGAVEIAGIVDIRHTMKTIGKSKKISKFQMGNCSKHLFLPEAKAKSSSQEDPSYYHNQNIANGYGYGHPQMYVEYPSHLQGYGYYDYPPHQEHMLPYYRY